MIDVRKLVPRSRRARTATAAVTVIALVGAVFLVQRQVTALPGDAVLRIDGQVVTEAQFDKRVDTLGALYGVVEPETSDERDEFHRDVAKSIAVSLMLDSAAKDHDIVISEKSARDTLSSMLNEQLGDNPQQAYSDLLAEFSVSENDILQEVSRQQAIARLFREVTQEAVDSVVSQDAKARYDADPAAFAVPEERRLANIVVATEGEAKAVLGALRKGRDFATVARARSLDDATSDSGGVIGLVQASELDSTYAEAAFAAETGALFGPVRSQYGWNVGKVVRVVPAKPQLFETVRDDAIDTLRSERAMEEWRSWLAGLIKGTDVEYADRYRPAHPDEPPLQTDPSEVARP